ncbi:mitochondrial ribosomal subunit protein-domain-containing protein [Amylostereum chailletii]|nr:mitochondrial ribosomal subunit protein-domain-containing protein [Amylostereum chailletii]
MSWCVHPPAFLRLARPSRSFSSSSIRTYPRRSSARPTAVTSPPSEEAIAEGLAGDVATYKGGEPKWDLEAIQDFEDDDTTVAGHLWLQQQRHNLHYLRLIEHEMPKLVAFRKPFIPPTSENPIMVRSISYAGEHHPAAAKRTIVVPVSQLPLRDEKAIHKCCVLAGVRWSPDAPKDSGVRYREGGSEHGYIKISCEDFKEPAMNLKWASDALDRLIAESNKTNDTFEDIPLDTRHIEAKLRKAGKGKLLGDIGGGRRRDKSAPSIKDFPRSWLPKPLPRSQATSSPLPQVQ